MTEGNAEAPARERRLTFASLAALYVIWGSTYFGIRVALTSFPPFWMAGLRYLVAGALLFTGLRVRRAPLPTRRQWLHALPVGFLLLGLGNGAVVFAEQTVSSGLAAVAIAGSPVFTAIFAGLFGKWPSRAEWLGLAVGLLGIGVLNSGGELRGSPVGAAGLLLATVAWAFGSIWSKRLDLAPGGMGTATEMIGGGASLVVMALLHREPFPTHVTPVALGAVAYLVVFGSIVAFSAYVYLLRHTRPTVATSYGFVNPMVALLLGAVAGNEHVGGTSIAAMLLILLGVGLITRAPKA